MIDFNKLTGNRDIGGFMCTRQQSKRYTNKRLKVKMCVKEFHQ